RGPRLRCFTRRRLAMLASNLRRIEEDQPVNRTWTTIILGAALFAAGCGGGGGGGSNGAAAPANPLPGDIPPVPPGPGFPSAVAVFATSQDPASGSVTAFSADVATGALGALPGSPLSVGGP